MERPADCKTRLLRRVTQRVEPIERRVWQQRGNVLDRREEEQWQLKGVRLDVVDHRVRLPEELAL